MAGTDLIELTPNNRQCLIGACPSVFMTPEGSYILIGKKVNSERLPPGRIGKDEEAVELDQDLLNQALRDFLNKSLKSAHTADS